jgi:hypothetical protein
LAAEISRLVDRHGPVGHQQSEVYLRTAVGVDPAGWAKPAMWCRPIAGVFCSRPKSRADDLFLAATKGDPAWQKCLRALGASASPHRRAGRHGAGLGRAAAFLGNGAEPYDMPPVSGQCRGRSPPVGEVFFSSNIRQRRPGRRRRCSSVRAADDNPAFSAR